MLMRERCGCKYLVHRGVVVLVYACDGDIDPEWGFVVGRRPRHREVKDLTPVPDDEAREAFTAWGHLIADGYDARDIAAALKRVGARNDSPVANGHKEQNDE